MLLVEEIYVVAHYFFLPSCPFFLSLLSVSVSFKFPALLILPPSTLHSKWSRLILCLSFSSSFLLFLSRPPAEPSRPHGGPDGRGHGEESEPSDDEMLSLSSQRGNASTAPPKPDPPAAMPAAHEPPEEVDLLGLDGEGISCPCSSSQPLSTAATATDLLGDLFGGPRQPTSGPSSTQSTPHKVVPNTASPCPSPAPPGEINNLFAFNFHGGRKLYLRKREEYHFNISQYMMQLQEQINKSRWIIRKCIIQRNPVALHILYASTKMITSKTVTIMFPVAFDPFGAGPIPKPQDMMGSFLGPGNVGQPDPFLHAARSPSPTLQPVGLGKACFCCSAVHTGF